MIRHYLIVACRNLWRNKLHSVLNILGLAIGVTCFILIFLFVKYELSYDKFNINAGRIYRIAVNGMLGNTEIHQTGTPPPLPVALYREFPEVEKVTRIMKGENVQCIYQKNIFTEDNLYIADSSFLKIFSIEFITGNPELCLNQPGQVVITDKIAKKYFASEDPVNKFIKLRNGNVEIGLRVSGVIKEVPNNSHFHPGFIISMTTMRGIYDSENWFNNRMTTYIKLRPNTDYKTLEKKFPDFVAKYFFQEGSYSDFIKRGNFWKYTLQPLTKIHLTSKLNGEFEANGNGDYIYILILAGIFILVIACINYMNLYTAKSFIRGKEIGLRKSFGATRGGLIRQILAESILLSCIAVILAVVIIDTILPYYGNFTGKPLEFNYLNPLTLALLTAFIIIVGIISGSYPALYLSSFRPSVILKQKSGSKNVSFRNILVIVQFSISICLIAGTIMVYKQLHYLRDENLGFDKENVLVIKNIQGLSKNLNAFVFNISSNPQVQKVSITSDLFDSNFINWGYGAEGKQTFTLNTYYCDTAYAEVLKLKMAQGRFFSSSYLSDSSGIVINETAAKMLEWKDPLNRKVNLFTVSKDLNIIGVIKDFNYESKQTQIRPMAIILLNGVARMSDYEAAKYMLVRLNPGNFVSTVDFIKNTWNQFSEGEPFNYSFLNEEYNSIYRNETKTQQLFSLFAIISIFIAGLGLFGLASYLALQRTKEVGVRKVNGATRGGIILLLSENYTKWVLVSFAIACPVSWFILNRWLTSFAYHADLKWWIFLAAGLTALFIALLTVSWQSWRAATRNPVETLRYE
jgi:putative ABC transport system permease protein